MLDAVHLPSSSTFLTFLGEFHISYLTVSPMIFHAISTFFLSVKENVFNMFFSFFEGFVFRRSLSHFCSVSFTSVGNFGIFSSCLL